MHIQETQHNAVTILIPHVQRIEASNAQTLKNTLIDTITRGSTKIALDLHHVDFMDSSGLAALLSALKRLGQNGRIALFGVSATVRKLFAITRLDNGIFTLADTEEEALQLLGHASGAHE